jgi:hypothetical protein
VSRLQQRHNAPANGTVPKGVIPAARLLGENLCANRALLDWGRKLLGLSLFQEDAARQSANDLCRRLLTLARVYSMVEVEHIITDSGNLDGFHSWENQGT